MAAKRERMRGIRERMRGLRTRAELYLAQFAAVNAPLDSYRGSGRCVEERFHAVVDVDETRGARGHDSLCMRPSATSACGLKLLVYEAFSY
jgi:hypothetical protein